jgi:parvulin-like peptidyl-prolyl isomerase
MSNISQTRLISGLLAVSFLFGCSGASLQGDKVATVNNQPIYQPELKATYQHILKMDRIIPESIENDPKNILVKIMFQKMALENLILTHLIQQEGEKQKIHLSDKEVEDFFQTQVAAMGGEKALEMQLSMMGMDKVELKKEFKDQLYRDKVVTALAGDKVDVSDAEAKDFYTKNPAYFDIPEAVHAEHILISTRPSQPAAPNPEDTKKQVAKAQEAAKKDAAPTLEQQRRKAEKILQEVKAHPDQFEKLAKADSDDKASAVQGGDLGFFTADKMVPSFSKAAFETKPGQIYPILVESPFGFHIIKVLDRRPAHKMTFEESKSKIVMYLSTQKKKAFLETWLEDIKKKAKIDIAKGYDFDKQMEDQKKVQADKAKADKAKPGTIDLNSKPGTSKAS